MDSSEKQYLSYLTQLREELRADFLLLSSDNKKELATEYGLDQDKPDFNAFEISAVWSMELLILKSLSREELHRRMWILREKFRMRVADDVFKAYKASLPDAISDEKLKQGLMDDTNHQLLIGDAVNLTRQMQRIGHSRMERNLVLNEQKRFPIWTIFFLISLGILLIFIDKKHPGFLGHWELIFLAMYFGMVGAGVSLLQRLEQASNTPIHFTTTAADSADISQGMRWPYMVSLVLSGAVFSVLVYLISLSGLLNVADILPGPPKEGCPKCTLDNYIGTVLCAPYGGKEIARLLILCFISGFAERFVPDVLDTLVKKAKST